MGGAARPPAAAVLATLLIPALLAGCSSRPDAEQVAQQRVDASRLSLVGTAIDDGPAATSARSGVPETGEGGGAAIVRADQPFVEIHKIDLRPGPFTVKALCLGRGTVRVTVQPDSAPTAARVPATSVTLRCGFSETYFGRDIATGVLGGSAVAVSMRAIGQADGAVAFRVRRP